MRQKILCPGGPAEAVALYGHVGPSKAISLKCIVLEDSPYDARQTEEIRI